MPTTEKEKFHAQMSRGQVLLQQAHEIYWGWSGGAIVASAGASYNMDNSRARAKARLGVLWTFLLSSILSPLSPSHWKTARYRLKYCLKGPLNPKQPTNQPTKFIQSHYVCKAPSLLYLRQHLLGDISCLKYKHAYKVPLLHAFKQCAAVTSCVLSFGQS